MAFILSLLCGALNLIRGFHAIESLLQSDGEDFNYIVAFFLGTAACLYQCYLLVYYTGWRNLKSFLTFGLICLCNMYLYELRNLWQLFFHVTVGAFVTLQIWLRQAQGKAPDYDVWHHPSDYCLGFWGRRKEHILTATVMKELFTTNEKLCFLSLQLSFFVLSQHGIPGSMQYLLDKLLSE